MIGSITLMVGLPACGKSTFLSDSDNVVLCPDDYRKVLTGWDFYAPAEDSVWSHIKITARVMCGIRNKHVIIDATNITVGSRNQWIRIAEQYNVPISCIVFDIPYTICIERNKHRHRKVPQDIMEKMDNSFEKPTLDEGFKEIRIITLEKQEPKEV